MAAKSSEVSASEVKNSWHEYLDRVSRERQEVVVTRYGKPVAKLVPIEPEEGAEAPPSIVGWMRGTVTFRGDIISPIDEKWDAES
jgi:prevent-host-death family protein